MSAFDAGDSGIIRYPAPLINSRFLRPARIADMCLILFAVNPSSRYRLIVAANRDELYARPTVSAGFWQEYPDLLAGKDENAGGTWLGITKSGRFSAVTNFAEQPPEPMPPLSRGDLPLNFLTNRMAPIDYVADVKTRGEQYRGFNLLVADREAVCYYGNRASEPRRLDDGYYGLSNQLLDCDWPKVINGRENLRALAETDPDNLADSMFDMLMDRGDGRQYSNSFIASDTYGTRATTVVLIDRDNEIYFEERNFGPEGASLKSQSFSLSSNS